MKGKMMLWGLMTVTLSLSACEMYTPREEIKSDEPLVPGLFSGDDGFVTIDLN